ncbi:hypothetical protein MHYP_G00359220 [Metynnis hypsauchen]
MKKVLAIDLEHNVGRIGDEEPVFSVSSFGKLIKLQMYSMILARYQVINAKLGHYRRTKAKKSRISLLLAQKTVLAKLALNDLWILVQLSATISVNCEGWRGQQQEAGESLESRPVLEALRTSGLVVLSSQTACSEGSRHVAARWDPPSRTPSFVSGHQRLPPGSIKH